MKNLLATLVITFLIACGPDSDRDGNVTSSSSSKSSSSTQETKSYAVKIDNGTSCNVMIRRGGVNTHNFTIQCPSGTKVGCMRAYDSSNFILGTKSSYTSSTSYGLVASDGSGNGSITVSDFSSIASISLHETSCN